MSRRVREKWPSMQNGFFHVLSILNFRESCVRGPFLIVPRLIVQKWSSPIPILHVCSENSKLNRAIPTLKRAVFKPFPGSSSGAKHTHTHTKS